MMMVAVVTVPAYRKWWVQGCLSVRNLLLVRPQSNSVRGERALGLLLRRQGSASQATDFLALLSLARRKAWRGVRLLCQSRQGLLKKNLGGALSGMGCTGSDAIASGVAHAAAAGVQYDEDLGRFLAELISARLKEV